MRAYALRRLLSALPTLFVIVTVAFFMMRAAPGGPFDRERALPPDIEANVLRAYNLDQPLWKQYVHYVGKLLQGDMGPSYKFRDFTVAELIGAGAPTSLQLGAVAIVLAVIAGVGLGTLAALRHNGALDHAVMLLAMTGIAVPNFVMAPLLTLILGVYLALLPVAGWGEGALANKILPVVALTLPQVAYVARLTRGSMLEVLGTDFIRTARAKGLRERLVVTRHALKGALLPVVSYLGPATAAVATGSVVVETIFDIPGIGRHFVQGALNRDYPLVMGVMIFYALLIITLNLLVDLLYGWLDPKVRYE